jgi:phosphoenolpyruvate carboxylase
MATQHPDNAAAPAWLAASDGFIDTRHEIEECHRSFAELGCTEYMWDWEGKHVDEAVIERLLEKHHAFFSRHQLGKDLFLTYRLPNVWVEKGYRIARAFASIISANDVAREVKLQCPPVFECILPLTTTGAQPYLVRRQYAAIAKAFGGEEISKAFALEKVGPADVRVIPLIEHPDNLIGADEILSDYAKACEQAHFPLDYLRVFIARSDPALNMGLSSAVIASKAALSRCAEFEEESGIPVHPMIGVGCLPFRGGLSPETATAFAKMHEGTHTYSIQSAFRYDYPQAQVKKAIRVLNGRRRSRSPDSFDYRKLAKLSNIFSKHYQHVIAGAATTINKAAAFTPGRRERKLHIGLFGYSRKVGTNALPRAIGFTCAAYSLGVPPELFGTGRGIAEARKAGLGEELEAFWPLLHSNIRSAGYYLNKENLAMLSAGNSAWKGVQQDVRFLEEFIGEPLGPLDEDHFVHRNLTSNILLLLRKGRDCKEDVVRAAKVRRSVG